MKKILFTALAGAALFTACSQTSNEYVIYGTVTDPDMEGVKIFLVPVDNPVVENIDSTYIHDNVFVFRGTEEKIADIRIERMKRYGKETLLVVTEPGEIHAVIGEVSTGMGTPQNDSLQLWKNMTKKYYQQARGVSADQAQELRNGYIERTRQMAKNVDKNSPLGKFLDSRFPDEAK